MKVVAVVASVLYFGALLAAVILWGRMTDFLQTPAGSGGELVTVQIPAGATAEDLPDLLSKAGLARDPTLFRTYVRRFRQPVTLSAGEFAIAPTMTPVQQIAQLESGEVVTYTFALRAGATSEDAVQVLVSAGLGDQAKLEALMEDPNFAKSLGIDGPSLEGFLFPDAYSLPRGLGERALLAKLVERYRASARELVMQATAKRRITEYDVVILASLVERARVLPKERPFYAAVLLNRLEAGKPLRSRAAHEYGLSRVGEPPEEPKNKWRRKAKRDHPWDTRVAPGLPKTPICSPSLASMNAVVNPAPVDALYMVPRDDGTYVYCVDLECFYAARQRYKVPTPAPPPPAPPL